MLHDLRLQGAALLIFALWFRDKQLPPTRELAALLNLGERTVRSAMPRVNQAIEQSNARAAIFAGENEKAAIFAAKNAAIFAKDKESSKEKEYKREIYINKKEIFKRPFSASGYSTQTLSPAEQENQRLAKIDREAASRAQSEQWQRDYEAAQTPEVQTAMEAFFAKHGKRKN